MTEQITYYAMVDGNGDSSRPAGVFRRVKGGDGQIDEVFSRHLKWEFSPLLYSAERGDTMYDFIPIAEEEASQIVAHLRQAASPVEPD